MSIFTPVNQNRLTNVAYVRIKKGGKHFEIACYKNKVQAWRNKTEKDLDEVLQTPTVFTNVSRGQIAKKDDLIKGFGTDNMQEICIKILEKGELQISEKERQSALQNTFKDIATIVANKCINKDTNKPYTITMIENAMKEIHFSVNPKKNSKQQALEVIKKLKDKLNIERVQMKILTTFNTKYTFIIDKMIQFDNTSILSKLSENNEIKIELLIDPGYLRNIDELIRLESKGQGTVDILSVMENKEITIEN